MKYAEFEQQIRHMVTAASEAARRAFSLDTIGLLYQSAKKAIDKDFTMDERRLLSQLLSGLEIVPTPELKRKLNQLVESQCRDSVRAIGYHRDATELICAIDSWLEYQLTRDPACVARLAICMVNSVDYAIGGDEAEYSVNNMLGSPAMVAEYQRQQRLLSAP